MWLSRRETTLDAVLIFKRSYFLSLCVPCPSSSFEGNCRRAHLLPLLSLLVSRNATFSYNAFDPAAFRAETALRGPVSRRSRDVLRSGVFGDSAFAVPFRHGLARDGVGCSTRGTSL